MPPKRTSAPSTANPAPKRISTRVRHRPGRPGDDRPNSPTPSVPADLAAFTEDVAGQLAEFDAALQTNTHQLNDITVFMNEIQQRMDSGMAQGPGGGPSSVTEPVTNSVFLKEFIFPK